eukprot:CAMPEP_0118910314 /NCGR_PEP_ID=MMETSP1166-20130328/12501_1 /TAXON_ID=1104430 /ORGANISM="Chrysoreinhardia sp, Strain CCMP3193" /LENGTH=813 /DNA_ID=CAMNT_0006849775 /DNA_START=24 /DNA_END=2465 /DNA_ORIENTATION=-
MPSGGDAIWETALTRSSSAAAEEVKALIVGSSFRSKVVRLSMSTTAPAFKRKKVAIAAKLAGVALEVTDVTDEELGAMGAKTCVVVTGEGPIARSGAVLRYVASVVAGCGLYGDTPYEESLVDAWLDTSVYEIEVPVVLVGGGTGGDAVPAARADVARASAVLDEALRTKTFLVTEAPTIADIATYCVLEAAFDLDLCPPDLGPKTLTNLARWLVTCSLRFSDADSALCKTLKARLLGAKPSLAVVAKGAAPASMPVPQAAGGGGAAAVPTTTTNKTTATKETTTTVPVSKEEGMIADELDKDPSLLYASVYSRSRTRVKELLLRAPLGSTVTVKGWARSVREAVKGTTNFVELNDGSTVNSLQVVASKDTTANFEALKSCGGTGSALSFVGTVVESMGKGQKIEVQATDVTVLGATRGGPNREAGSAKYPLAKKFHTPEHLRANAHLRPRSRLGSAVVRIRHALAFATHEFFQKKGFLYVHTPLITGADCEGAGEQFTVTTLLPEEDEEQEQDGVSSSSSSSKSPLKLPLLPNGAVDYSKDFFGKRCGLTVSGQLNVETHAVALSDCYTFGPTFRAENSHTSRHLAEFWMIEPELSFGDLEDDMHLATDYLKYCVASVVARCDDDLAFFEQAHEKGLRGRLGRLLEMPFPKLEYTEAIEILQKAIRDKAVVFENTQVVWGMDLNSEHEKYLAEVVYEGPVVLVNYPKDIKAFYMKLNPDAKTVAAMDILVPKIGEIIGGSQREDDLDVLEARCKEVGLDPEGIKWYTDLRLYGSVPHAGFGLGFERLVMLVTGVDNIRDAIPFPRYPGHAEF